MLSEWRQLSTLTRIFYIVGLSSFIGLAVMILTSMTGIGAIWELFKRRPFCMRPKHGDRRASTQQLGGSRQIPFKQQFHLKIQ
jgi:hypothetical protein